MSLLLVFVSVAFGLFSSVAFGAEFPTGVFSPAKNYSGNLQIFSQTGASSPQFNVSIELSNPQGHSCSFSGSGSVEGGILTAKSKEEEGGACVVKLAVKNDSIQLESDIESCRSFCGMKAILEGSFPVKSRVKGSEDFDAAKVSEWMEKAGKDSKRLDEISSLLLTIQAAKWPEHKAFVHKHILQVHPVAMKLWKAKSKKQAVMLLDRAAEPLYDLPEAEIDALPSDIVMPLIDLAQMAEQFGDPLIPEEALRVALRKDPERSAAWLVMADFRWKEVKVGKAIPGQEADFFRALEADQKFSLYSKSAIPSRVLKRCSICAEIRGLSKFSGFKGEEGLNGSWKLSGVSCTRGRDSFEVKSLNNSIANIKNGAPERRLEFNGERLVALYVGQGKNLVSRSFDLKVRSNRTYAVRTEEKKEGTRDFDDPPILPLQEFELSLEKGPVQKLKIEYGPTIGRLYCKKGNVIFAYERL